MGLEYSIPHLCPPIYYLVKDMEKNLKNTMNKESMLKSDSRSPRIQGNLCKAWCAYTCQQLESCRREICKEQF